MALHRVVVEGVIAPEGFGKILAAQVIHHRLDAGKPTEPAAFNEIACQRHDVVGQSGEHIAAPGDGLIGIVLDVGGPGSAERGIFEQGIRCGPR